MAQVVKGVEAVALNHAGVVSLLQTLVRGEGEWILAPHSLCASTNMK
jgi:hypothetical protein